MIAAEVALRTIGAFYVFASLLGMRSMVMDHVMDQMLAGISLKPIPKKDHQRRWLLSSSVLAIGMGGMALMVLSLWAVPLFLLGAATQAFYLVWARTAFPPEDDSDRTGRRQTTNAAVLYGGVTLLVCLAASFGLLRPWLDPWSLVIPAAGLILLFIVGRHFLWDTRRTRHKSWDDSEPPPYDIPPPPARVLLAPWWGGYPLRNADTDDGVIYDDYLPRELADRLYEWSRAFMAATIQTSRNSGPSSRMPPRKPPIGPKAILSSPECARSLQEPRARSIPPTSAMSDRPSRAPGTEPCPGLPARPLPLAAPFLPIPDRPAPSPVPRHHGLPPRAGC
jgi:hypothetical protein